MGPLRKASQARTWVCSSGGTARRLARLASDGPGAPRAIHSLRASISRLRQWRQPVRHADLGRALRDERALIAVGRAEIALFDRLFRLHGRMSGPETQQLHQQRAGRLCAAHHVEEALGAPVGDAAAIDVEPGGGNALGSGAIVDVELGGAARQARIALQVELAGGIVAAVAGDAAVVEDRLDAGGVVVARRSGLRIGASNAAG